MYPRIQNFFSPTLTTISLVQGDALGGGFERALASDVIVAEESAQMGLPEILFNLFPGMGAYSLLARRIGMRAAEELILSGKVLPAAEAARDGRGRRAGEGRRGRDRGARLDRAEREAPQRPAGGVCRARQLVNPVTREELDDIADVWVDAALRLGDRDLRMMSRIVRAQMRRMEAGDVTRRRGRSGRGGAAGSGWPVSPRPPLQRALSPGSGK